MIVIVLLQPSSFNFLLCRVVIFLVILIIVNLFEVVFKLDRGVRPLKMIYRTVCINFNSIVRSAC